MIDRKVLGSDIAATGKAAEAASRRIWEMSAGKGALPEGVHYQR